MIVLTISCKEEVIKDSMWILQQGFYLEGKTGSSIRQFLLESCHINETYITEKIKTVFLSGKPVDNLDKAKITAESTLAISGALPGLVGAMMRMDSIYAPLRSSITHQNFKIKKTNNINSLIKMKLFNKPLTDIGPLILQNGIILTLEDTNELLSILERNKTLSLLEINTKGETSKQCIEIIRKAISAEKHIKIIFTRSKK